MRSRADGIWILLFEWTLTWEVHLNQWGGVTHPHRLRGTAVGVP